MEEQQNASEQAPGLPEAEPALKRSRLEGPAPSSPIKDVLGLVPCEEHLERVAHLVEIPSTATSATSETVREALGELEVIASLQQKKKVLQEKKGGTE